MLIKINNKIKVKISKNKKIKKTKKKLRNKTQLVKLWSLKKKD